MGVSRVTKIYRFHDVSPIFQFYEKVVLRMSEHGDVIEMQTTKVRLPPKVFLANFGPCCQILALFSC